MIQAVRDDEDCLIFISKVNFYLPIARVEVQGAENNWILAKRPECSQFYAASRHTSSLYYTQHWNEWHGLFRGKCNWTCPAPLAEFDHSMIQYLLQFPFLFDIFLYGVHLHGGILRVQWSECQWYFDYAGFGCCWKHISVHIWQWLYLFFCVRASHLLDVSPTVTNLATLFDPYMTWIAKIDMDGRDLGNHDPSELLTAINHDIRRPRPTFLHLLPNIQPVWCLSLCESQHFRLLVSPS